MIRHIIKSPSSLARLLDNMGAVVGFDTETTSLDIRKMDLEGFSIADSENALYYSISSSDSNFPKVKSILAKFLSTRKLVIMHNATFDLKVIRKFFCCDRNVNPFCTYIGYHLCNENEHEKGLKALAISCLLVPVEEILTYEEARQFGKDSPEFADYATNDAVWSYQLYSYEKAVLQSEGCWYLAKQVEMPFLKYLVDMEYYGIGVDLESLTQIKEETESLLFNLEKRMLSLIGKKHECETLLWGEKIYKSPINFGSTQQLAKIITEDLGLEIKTKTKKKELSCSKESLEKLEGNEFIDTLLEWRQHKTMLDKFLEPLPTFVDDDGRVRASFNIVTTGRLSASRPPMQQLKKEEKNDDVNYRSLFIESPDFSIIKSDFSSQELCLLAEVTQDKVMIDAINRGEDLHLKTANRIFDLDLTEDDLLKNSDYLLNMDKEQEATRKKGKIVNFSIAYGTTKFGMSRKQGISKDEAEKWINGFFDLYPSVKEHFDSIEKQLLNNGFVTTLFLRRRRFPFFAKLYDYWSFERNKRRKIGKRFELDRMIRQAFNFLIQGSASDMCKIAGARIAKVAPEYGARCILQVHDELVVGCPNETVEEFAVVMREIMENVISISVPINVDLKIVKKYGD